APPLHDALPILFPSARQVDAARLDDGQRTVVRRPPGRELLDVRLVEAVGRPDEDPDALDLADPVLSDHRRLTFFGYLASVTSWLRGRPLESTHFRVAKLTPAGSSRNSW